MSNDGDNHLVDAAFTLLVLAGIIFLIYLIAKFIFNLIGSLIPPFLFYLVPFVVLSFIFGVFFEVSSTAFTMRRDSRMLAIGIPLLSLLLYAVVGTPERQFIYTFEKEVAQKGKKAEQSPVGDEKSPKEKPPKVDIVDKWPWLSHLYRQVESSLDLDRKWPWQGISYAQEDLAMVFWLALYLGAPYIFVLKSKERQEEEEKQKRKTIEAPLEAKLNETEEKVIKFINEKIQLERILNQHQTEIERLRKRDEYLTKREKERAGSHKGVLDSDDF